MIHQKYSKRHLPLYLVPILIGLGGILFSRQLDDLSLRGVVLLLSAAVPMFAGGTLLVRHQASHLDRLILLGGVILLLLGATVSVSGYADRLGAEDIVPAAVVVASRWLGLFSLMLGLFGVLYSAIATGENIGEIAARFKHLAEHINEGFILSRADGRVLMVNDQFLTMCGLTRAEVEGHMAHELALKLNLDAVTEHLENRSRGIASEYEVSWRVNNEDRRFWFNGTPIFDRSGKHAATLATVRDVTDFHRLSQRVEEYAESLQEQVQEQTAKLQRSEKRLRRLLESMNEGFLTMDTAHRVRFANDSVCRLLNLESDALLGQDIFNFVEAKGRVRLMNLLARGEALEGAEARQELAFINGRGDAVPTVVALSHISGAKPGDPAFSLVVTSVAELKAMQRQLELRAQELERANEALREHDQAKDRFLSNVSHELRTPLSTIQGYVELLESGNLGSLEGPQVAAVQVLGRNVTRLLGHINEMIEFSRMEIRGIHLNTSLFSPVRLVEEAVASAHPQALAKDISLNSHTRDDFAYAWGDPEKLGQVLTILLSNALKFTPRGGMVSVHAMARPDHTLAIAVKDTGIGIGEAHQKKIFTKFFQVDSSMTRRFEGTGIGLSIAKNIMEAHKAFIELQSAPGEGSTFTLVMPGVLLSTEMDPALAAGFGGLKLLVVDDTPEFCEIAIRILSPFGVSVACVANGYQCVRAAKEEAPNLIVLNDIRSELTGMNSISLLRQHPATEEIPLLVFSLEGSHRFAEAAELWQNVVCMPIPFDARSLVRSIRLACFDEAPEAEAGLAPVQAEHQGTLVLVVDSDPSFLEWVETALNRRGIACCCALAPEKAVEICERERPDAIFLDVDVSDQRTQDEIAIIRECEHAKTIPLYAMTGVSSGHTAYLGITGMLRKPFSIEDLIRLSGLHNDAPVTKKEPSNASGA